MKIRSIVALLGLTVSVSAFAAPFVSNDSTPSVINPAPGTEDDLQEIADDLFGPGHVNVFTGQSSAGMFSSATPNLASTVPTLFAEFTANDATQVFGIWFGTNTDNVIRYDLILGGATSGRAAGITIAGNTLEVFSSNCSVVNCGTFSNALINPSSFGFYFRASDNAPTYHTLDQLNTGTPDDRVVAFQDGATTNWLFAYEDGDDFDYNDMAVKVESIVANPIPEPETYALMLAGLGVMGYMNRRRKRD